MRIYRNLKFIIQIICTAEVAFAIKNLIHDNISKPRKLVISGAIGKNVIKTAILGQKKGFRETLKPLIMAERERFELSVGINRHTISSRAP